MSCDFDGPFLRCFKPKPPKSKSSTTSPQKEKPPPPPPPKPSHPLENKEPSKSRKKLDFHASSSLSRTSRFDAHFSAMVELVVGEPSTSTVETIFRSGWAHDVGHTIEKVLKVNHCEEVVNKFEEYRKLVMSKAKQNHIASKRMKRVMVDGNELLRFRGAAITCSLGFNGVSSICSKKCCGVCRVVGASNTLFNNGGSMSFCEKSWNAHEKVTKECVVNGMSARKAIIICRVIAGCVVNYGQDGIVEGEERGFDSVVASNGDESNGFEELVVLNSRAILPCFVVIYSVP
ncbi:hypothetical protein F0562_016974 [Nyssa sinensis]|uniref:PARP catalytic domain-containing protein n=1 Tax=Nyssa sinensis TaxID=561372 RepID=A0A5J4ZDH2_9ASTE|nr:hypothetical protein F0562_016974 [Nyssa sinensis]